MLSVLLSILVDDILPILLVAAVGFLLARILHAESRTLSRITFYALSPCLIFNLLTTSRLNVQALGQMTLFAICLVGGIGLLAWLVSIPLRLEPEVRSGLLLTVMFANAGNLGLPMVLFAFGQDALARASVFFVVTSALSYSLGVFIACNGRQGLRGSLLSMLTVPSIYAVALAGLVLLTGAVVPAPIARPVKLLSDAAIPCMILVLGMQLERTPRIERWPVVGLATTFKLVIAPLLAVALAGLLGLEGGARQAGISQAGAPAAVTTTILATEFDAAPAFVTNVVTVSTLLCPLTLTILIALLQH